MKLRLSLLALLLGSALANAATPTAASELDQLRAENSALKAQLEAQKNNLHGVTIRRVGAPPAAQLGFMVAPKTDRATVLHVRPGSPAEKAGLRQGDELRSLNGQSVSPQNPMATVMSALGSVKPGDAVQLGIQRDGKLQTLSATAEARGNALNLNLDGLMKNTIVVDGKALSTMNQGEVDVIVRSALDSAKDSLGNLDIDKIVTEALSNAESNGNVMVLGAHGERALGNARVMMLRRGLMGLDLAPVNPDLGRYFGATTGALVLSDPKESTSPLRAGDVIQSINGTAVTAPPEVWKALHENTGQPSTIEVFRDRRKIALTLPATAPK